MEHSVVGLSRGYADPEPSPAALREVELSWLGRLSAEMGHRVICAADFMERRRGLLEARWVQLYEEMPASDRWHAVCTCGDADAYRYGDHRKECAQASH